MTTERRLVGALMLALTCSACMGLGDFDTPRCDQAGKTQVLELPAEVRALTRADGPSGSAFVLETRAGEPRALAQLSREGSWEQRAIDLQAWCGEGAACSVTGLALAPLASEYVLALTLQPAAATCSRLRLALADRFPEPVLHGGDAASSLFHGVRLDAQGCTRGGVWDARVAGLAKEPNRDVLLVWRTTEPSLAEGPCAEVGDSYITTLSISAPPDGLGLFSDERESLRCLGASARAPSVVASPRVDGYYVGFMDSAALRIQFVPAYGDERQAVASLVWPLPDADLADRLGLTLSVDERQLAAHWTAGEHAYFAAFEVAPDLTLKMRSHAALPVHGALNAEPLALRVDTGLLDWSSYQSDSGWLYVWMSGSDDASRLYAARISDRTGKPLAALLQLAEGRLFMPMLSRNVTGGFYGFVRYDKTSLTVDRAQLELHSTQCAIAARL